MLSQEGPASRVGTQIARELNSMYDKYLKIYHANRPNAHGGKNSKFTKKDRI